MIEKKLNKHEKRAELVKYRDLIMVTLDYYIDNKEMQIKTKSIITMNFADIKDKKVSLIVWNTEKEDDLHVYLGRLQMENGESHFVNVEKGWRVTLDEEQLSRLQPVSDDLKETLLNADYALSMSMGDLVESNQQDYRTTGMSWQD